MNTTLYEVYPKRAIHEPITDLVMMDRGNNKKKMIVSARKWGAVVVKVECKILTKYPLTRDVISTEIVFVHKPAKHGRADDQITRKVVMGKFKKVYKQYRRK